MWAILRTLVSGVEVERSLYLARQTGSHREVCGREKVAKAGAQRGKQIAKNRYLPAMWRSCFYTGLREMAKR